MDFYASPVCARTTNFSVPAIVSHDTKNISGYNSFMRRRPRSDILARIG